MLTLGKSCTCNEFKFDRELRARFEFGGRFGQDTFRCVSQDQQEQFQNDFRNQFETVRKKLAAYGWTSPPDALLPPRVSAGPYQPGADFNVFVSEAYDRSIALVPAWLGKRGWMEFPAHRVVAGEASIAHEIVHVLFPNGNRMLAEGLAVYLQHKLFPEIPVYPNFGDELEALVAEFIFTNYPKRTPYALWNMDLGVLERSSTPDGLSMRIGRDILVAATSGDPNPAIDAEKFLYAVAGSFVKFLLENPYGIGGAALTESNFGKLYLKTPLQPLDRNAGDPKRWEDCYQDGAKAYSFMELTLLWKTYMHFILCGKFAPNPDKGRQHGLPIPNTPPEKYDNNPLVKTAYAKLNAIR
jgi:hypothetical protein